MKYKELSSKISAGVNNRLIGIKNTTKLLNVVRQYGEKINNYDVYYTMPDFNQYFEFKNISVDHDKGIILFEMG